MAELTINLANRSLTSLIDNRANTRRDAVRVPLAPLAEWIVSNWWFIWHEPDSHSPAFRRGGFSQRHDLRWAADGFAFPSISMISTESRAVVSAVAYRAEHSRIEYLTQFSGEIAKEQLESELRRLVDSTIERIVSADEGASFLVEEWNSISDLSPEEIEFCRAAALLGHHAFELEDSQGQILQEQWNSIDSALRDDLFSASEIDAVEAAATWVTDAADRAENAGSQSAWNRLRTDLRFEGGDRPWRRGFQLARQVRQQLHNPDGIFEFDGELSVPVGEVEIPSARIDAVVASNSPSCLMRKKPEKGKRFAMARAVGDFLAKSSAGPRLLTSLSTDRQAQSRSFAAELLAPAASIRRQLGDSADGLIDVEESERIADYFRVSPMVIEHQIRNHNLGDIVEGL
jgi:hypothetical protein